MDMALTADEAMEMERFLTFTIDNGVDLAQSADGSLIWLPQLLSGQHNLEEEEDEAAEFFDRASDDDGQDDDDDDGVAYQSDPEFGYPTEETVQGQGNNYINTVVILNLLAQQLEVDFQTVLHDLVFGDGAYYDDGGAGLLGAFVVPASDAAVAGLEKQAFHATAEGCGVTGCAICLEEFEDGEEVTVMPCSRGHEFHPGCITEWLGQSNTCPLCRHALPTDVDDDDP